MQNPFRTAWIALGLLAASAPAQEDIFLLIGQSNMAGRGVVEEQDRKPMAGVFVFNKERQWAPAIDPLHFDRPDRTGVGLGRSFAATLIAMKASTSVGLVPAAFGGSALDEWMPGTEHYRNAVERTKAALARGGRLRGILWHQGEADSSDAVRAWTYGERFEKFIAALRKDLGAEQVPVIVGQLGEFVREKTEAPLVYASQVNQALATLPLRVPLCRFVSSEGLGHKGDVLHFDSRALREFGRRYALAWLSL
jgi:hypothetical protein